MNLSELRACLSSLGLRPRRALSQNFLIDRNIVEKLVAAADIEPGEWVLEIGPGLGAITQVLLRIGAHVVAVEKDPALARGLAHLQTEPRRLHIHCADILDFPLDFTGKVVSNLPYHISSPILTRLVPLSEQLSTITVIVQKEVAERYVAIPNTAAYSSISVYLQFFSDVQYLFTIPKGCFYPAPKVESAAVSFTLKTPPLISWESFFELVRTAFNQRRKMLRSSLRDRYPGIQAALAKLGKSERARPQEFSVEDFLALYQGLD